MKDKKVVFIVLGIIAVIIVALGLAYHFRDRRTYELNLPEIEKIARIELEQNADGVALFGSEEIKDIRDVLYGVKRITETESIQDSPVNVDDEIKVNFYFDEKSCSTLFVYKKNSKYYIEQPYNGIYRISPDEYNAIEKYIRDANKVNNSSSTKPYIPNGQDNSDNNEIGNAASTQNFNRSPENVTIEVLEDTITNESAEILITDKNEDHYGWGVDFRVQKKVNDKWEELNPIAELSFIEVAYEVGENNQLKLKTDYGKYYGTLEKGIYRIVKPVYDKHYINLFSNEFEIK